jgi:hypothetical protein
VVQMTAALRLRLERIPESRLLGVTIAVGLVASLLAFGAWTLVRAPFDAGIDLPIYEEAATNMLGGQVPYRDFSIEYPPGALPMFVLPAVMFGDARDAHWSPPNARGHRYQRAFNFLVVALTAAMVIFTALSLDVLRRPTGARLAAVALVASSPLLIGHVFVQRYDVWPTALTAAALAAALHGRFRLGGAALGLGVAAKLYPLLLVPVLLIVAARQRGVREAIAAAVSAALAAAVVFAPFAIASWNATWQMVRNQLSGGLQVETVTSSLLVLTRHLSDWLGLRTSELTVRPEQHGLNRAILAGADVGATKTILNVLLVIALCVIWIKLARSSNDPREDLVRYAALTIAVALVLGTVLSAQFITWLIPLVPLVAGRRGAAATFAFVVAAALTHVWFPSAWYGSYLTNFDLGATSILSARNLALIVCALVLALPSRGALGAGRKSSAPPRLPTNAVT